MLPQEIGHRRNQRVGVFGIETPQDGEQRRIGHDPGEQFGVLDLPRHQGPRHPGVLQDRDAPPQLPQ